MAIKESHGIKGLIAAVLIDITGYSTYIFPALGEFGDIVWAPISAYLIFKIFKSKTGAAIGFIEEILPFSDFIPTATIIWVMKHFEIGPLGKRKGKFVDGLDPDDEIQPEDNEKTL